MKFLAIQKLKDVTLSLPPSVLMPIYEASIAANKQLKKEGKILEQYHCPQPDRTVFILNYDSAEQWQKDQEKIPILQFCDTEVYPLADFDEYTKASLQSMKAAAKMMAAGAK